MRELTRSSRVEWSATCCCCVCCLLLFCVARSLLALAVWSCGLVGGTERGERGGEGALQIAENLPRGHAGDGHQPLKAAAAAAWHSDDQPAVLIETWRSTRPYAWHRLLGHLTKVNPGFATRAAAFCLFLRVCSPDIQPMYLNLPVVMPSVCRDSAERTLVVWGDKRQLSTITSGQEVWCRCLCRQLVNFSRGLCWCCCFVRKRSPRRSDTRSFRFNAPR